MEKYHDITNKLWEIKSLSKCEADKIIRQDLEERAGELVMKPHSHLYARQILGLTDEENVENFWACGKHKTTGYTKGGCHLCPAYISMPEQKQSCIEEHSNWVKTEYSYCPSCGCELLNPRPTPKPLVERVATVMWECSTKTTTFDNADQRVRGDWLKEAQAALDFLREHKGEL